MAFYTQHNLKVRLDEDALFPVTLPLKTLGQYEDSLLDLELWEKLPNAISTVTAILTAFLTESWGYTLLFALLGFYVGLLIQELFYSDLLENLFPMFLGSWMIALPATVFVSFLLIRQELWGNFIVLGLVFLANWFNFSDILLLFWMPFSLFFAKRRGIGTVEKAFIAICNQKASKLGLTLDWEVYDKIMQQKNA